MQGYLVILICFISCLTSTVNSLGHVEMVSYPIHTFPGQALPKWFTSCKCSIFIFVHNVKQYANITNAR